MHKILTTKKRIAGLVLGLIVVILGAFAFWHYYGAGSPAALLLPTDWLNFPGATNTSQGIHFSPLGRIIVHQDGSEGQANPPVNVEGAHLKVSGDFVITAALKDIDQQSSVRLYAAPPLVYDQWRYEPPSIEAVVNAANSTVTVRIWDGSSSNSVDMRTSKVALSKKTTLALQHAKNQFTVMVNGRAVDSLPDHAIFADGTIWFGADGLAGSTGWTLVSLVAQALKGGSVQKIPAALTVAGQIDSNSLRNLADHDRRPIKIGGAVAISPLLSDEKYRALALGQFSIITPENSLKPEFIHPQPDVYDFAEADRLVDIAQKNNIAVHGHALLYDKSSPEWMVKSPKKELEKIMREHIQKVVSHFAASITEWDVVNEPFSQKQAPYKNNGTGLEHNFWFEAMGEQYIDLAFAAAHEASPSAKLYLNDYGVERDGQRWDALLALVKRLKQRGVPIDGVGFESHVYTDGDYLDAGQLKQHMKTLANLGLLTRISEIDVTGDDADQQTNQYALALDVCLLAPNCTSYTTWGISDAYGSTTRSDRYPLVYGTSLLWDKDFKPKPALEALQKRLKQ